MDAANKRADEVAEGLRDAITYCDAAMHPSEQYLDDRQRLIQLASTTS